MRLELIRDRAGLERLGPRWNDLLAASRADNAFLTWEFVSTWLDILRPDCELRVIAARDESGALAGIAPFYLAPLKLAGALGYRCLRVLGDDAGAADYPDVIVRTEREAEVLEAMGEQLAGMPGWDCLWMARMSGWSGALERVQTLCAAGGFHLHTRLRAFSFIPLPDTFDAYLGNLSKSSRYNLRRGRRQYEDSGGGPMRSCERAEDVGRFIGDLERLHQRHWNAAGAPGTFRRNPGQRDFFEEVSHRFLTRGWLRLVGLEIRGSMEAVQFCYDYGGSCYAIQEGYNPDLADEITCGIGNVLRAGVLESAIAEGLRVYDFLEGETWHKQRWGADVRAGHDAFVLRHSLRTLPLRAREIWPTGRYMSWSGPASPRHHPAPVY